MTILDDLIEAVDKIAKASWDVTDGTVVPETEDIGLGNKGVQVEVAMFYADLADSTELASHDQKIAAEVYKAFLVCGTKLILHYGGYAAIAKRCSCSETPVAPCFCVEIRKYAMKPFRLLAGLVFIEMIC